MLHSRASRYASVLAAIALLACSGARAGEVVLYSSNSVEAINAVADDFNKKYPDIHISPVRGSTGAMMQRIKAEAAAPKGDIFWSGGFSVLGLYKDYFAAYRSPEESGLSAAFVGPGDLWSGTNAHVM